MSQAKQNGPTQGQAVVIGGGHFGALAVKRLPGRVSLVVEPQPSRELLSLGVPVRAADGIGELERLLTGPNPPRWIVPALPRHLLKDWLVGSLANQNPRQQTIPPEVLPEAGLVIAGDAGQYYLSVSNFTCPDDCPEPGELCTVTGEPRGVDMWRRLAAVAWPQGEVGVLRSRQLAPGVGGLLTREMLHLRQAIAERGGSWLLATACRCHGVVDAVAFDPRG